MTSPPLKRPLILIALPLAAALAACGSSKAPGVQQAPSGGLAQPPPPRTVTVPPALRHKPTVNVSSKPPANHLVIKDLVKGTGAPAAVGGTITVNYVGVLYKTGKEFDSSWKRNQTFTTTLSKGRVIDGWVQGIPGMRVGGRRVLVVPPNLGYGKAGSPPTIPPNATLVFVVDLLSAT